MGTGRSSACSIRYSLPSEETVMKHILLLLVVILFAQAGAAFALDPSICGPNADVSYYADGKLKSCSNMDRTYVQGDLSCNASSQVSFFENGLVSECTASGSYTVGNITCGESGTISFYTSGALKSCTLKNPTVINGKNCLGSQPVNLFEDGNLSSCSEQ
jgi:hypothetical protein